MSEVLRSGMQSAMQGSAEARQQGGAVGLGVTPLPLTCVMRHATRTGRAGRPGPQCLLAQEYTSCGMWWHLEMCLDKSVLNPTDTEPGSSQALAST